MCDMNTELSELHGKHHIGIDRSFRPVKMKYPEVEKSEVAKIVRNSEQCQKRNMRKEN